MVGGFTSSIALALLLTASTAASAAFRFDDFSSTKELRLRGHARVQKKKFIRLTGANENRAGSVWFIEKQKVSAGFDTTFQFQITEPGGLGPGADGFAFVLQNSGPAELGGLGSAGGFGAADPSFHGRDRRGIARSIGIFFDTFQNQPEGDPSANSLSLRTHGRPTEMHWPADRLGLTPNLPVSLKDGRIHTARIRFQPPVVSVYLDGIAEPVLQSTVDLSLVVDDQGSAWAGFTASTGGGYENHDILSWSFTSEDVSSTMTMVSSEITFLLSATCVPDRNLCTPEKAVVERNGDGYHVVLPAHLEWGASVPALRGMPVIAEAHGITCWDRARGVEGCSGPSGNKPPAGPGFVSPGQPPGALVFKMVGGRVFFSVNGHTGQGFQHNEGFYEFDFELR